MLFSRHLRLPRNISHFLRTQSSDRTYTMAPTARINPPPDNRPIVISGPSGVGKGTLYKLLLTKYPTFFATTISHTTRSPRPGETPDVDYYYVSMEGFEKVIEEGGFVEHAKFGGNRYGTSKKTIGDLTASGRVVVLDIEMEGVKQIHYSSLSARYIFIAPPSMEILKARLTGRGTESNDSVQKRLAQAVNEMEYSKTPGVHDLIIVNDDLDQAYKELENFIWKNERMTKEQEPESNEEGKAGVSVHG